MKKNNKFEITTITPMDVLGTSLMNQVLGKKRWGGKFLPLSCGVSYRNDFSALSALLYDYYLKFVESQPVQQQ